MVALLEERGCLTADAVARLSEAYVFLRNLEHRLQYRNDAQTHAMPVADDELYWPYEGEYWRDELGTYQYTLTKGCKDRPPRSSAP